MRSFEPFTETSVRHVLSQVCLAMKYLHERKILHRDIKLENVLVAADDSEGCVVKLADLGCSETVS